MSLDQRALDADVLADMLANGEGGESERVAEEEEDVSVEWERLCGK